MKKPLLIVTLLIAVILLVAPKVIGMRLQDMAVDAVARNMPATLAPYLSVTQEELNAGWFSSDGKLVFSVDADPSESLSVSFDIIINHGPLLFTPQGFTLGLGYFTATPDLSSLEQQAQAEEIPLPNLGLWANVGFSENFSFGADIAPYEITDNSESLSISGIHINADIDTDKSAVFSGKFGNIRFDSRSENMALVIEEISISGETEDFRNPLSPATQSMSMPLLTLSGAMDLTVRGSELSGKLEVEGHPPLLNVLTNMSVANIEGDVPVSSIQFEQNILGISKALTDWYLSAMEMTNNFQAQDPEIFMEVFMEGGVLLLQSPLTQELNISANAFGGDHNTALTIKWLGIDGATTSTIEDLINTGDFASLYSTVQANWLIELDELSILRSPARDFLQPYIDEGMLTPANGVITIDVQYRDGNITANDETFSIEQFL